MKRNVPILLTAFLLLLSVSCKSSGGANSETMSADAPHTFAGYPVVYLTTDVSSEGLLAVYEALEASDMGTVAVKTSEPEDGYPWPELTEDLMQAIGEDPVVDFAEGPNSSDYDHTIFLTHFRRHETAGFSGTVANLASVSSQAEENGVPSPNGDEWMRSLAERGAAAAETLKEQALYLAVLDHSSIDDPSHDVAVLSSYDPVALDQACVDLVNMTKECQALAVHIEECSGLSTLIHAEQMGLGSRTYAFSSIEN